MAQQAKNELVTDIIEDAKKEAGKIISDAQLWKAERIRSTQQQSKQIFEDAKNTAAGQIAIIDKTTRSALSVEQRRLSLRVRDEMLQAVIADVEKQFEALVGTPEYRKVLFGWIAEGVLGLGIDTVIVNASKKEIGLIDKKMLSDVEKKIEELTGQKITIQLSEDQPLIAQGVFLTAADNSMAFNNQVHTRILRYQSAIRKMIFDRLFPTEAKEKDGVQKEDNS